MGAPDRSEFRGKVVVITGAGSGIGRATALLFSRLGATVHLVDLDGARAETVRATIEREGGQAVAYAVDCTDPAAMEELAGQVFAEEGGVDVLYNNAGIGHAGDIEDTPLEDWQRVINVNLMSTVHGVHVFVPRLLKQGRPAHIINTASALGLFAVARTAPYSASKFAIVGLTEALDAELSGRGIRVSAICPGIIDTAIVRDGVMRGEMAEKAETTRAFYRNRGTSPEVVAKAVVATVRRPRLVVPVPRWQVTPAWMLKRASLRASQVLSRNMTRAIR